MSEGLSKVFTSVEVKATVDQMVADKTPGPDGMSGTFYQRFWGTVGADVTQVVLNILNHGGFGVT